MLVIFWKLEAAFDICNWWQGYYISVEKFISLCHLILILTKWQKAHTNLNYLAFQQSQFQF